MRRSVDFEHAERRRLDLGILPLAFHLRADALPDARQVEKPDARFLAAHPEQDAANFPVGQQVVGSPASYSKKLLKIGGATKFRHDAGEVAGLHRLGCF